MQSDGDVSSATDSEGPYVVEDFTMDLLQLPLCVDCEALVKAHVEPWAMEVATYYMEAPRSEFTHTTNIKAEICSLCFCIWHLVPVDLPQSTPIQLCGCYTVDRLFAITVNADRNTPGPRSLGEVYIGEKYLSQHSEPAATVDFQAISKVLRECEEQHHHHSWSLSRHQSPVSILLIDVKDLMIIEATTRRRYLALSYVWGDHDSFASTTKTRESIAQKGGLGKHMHEIPQTIKDAMKVVRNLGERYLWVDRLCIEQDNATQKGAQIQAMDVIYSRALVTIVAHAGLSAESPLPGLRPGTRLGLPAKRIGDFVISVVPPDLLDSGAPHEKRGWTLQEQLLSQRCLYFDYHTTWFQCDKGLCREDRPDKLVQPPDAFNMHPVQISSGDNMEGRALHDIWKSYVTIIESYRTRELKYAQDTVYAIHGIARMISDLLETPVVSAVPLRLLPCALQFYHMTRTPEPARIRSAPSWSWAGWRDSTFYEGRAGIFHVSADSVALEMKVECKRHAPNKVPMQDVCQPGDPHTVDITEEPMVPAPLYTLLDIECSSTKASAFIITSELEYWETYDPSTYAACWVYDQGGNRCGRSFGIAPSLSENDYHSDKLQWILVSRSQVTWEQEAMLADVSNLKEFAWSMRYIMLIRWSQTWGFWERVCIAHVVENAWEAASPEITRVLLG